MNKNKTKEIVALEFKPLTDKKERKEIIQWLNDNCFLFSGISLPSDIKLNISDEVKERKSLYGSLVIEPKWNTKEQDGFYINANNHFVSDFQNRGIDLYIIKQGNAFSWIDYSVRAHFYKEGEFTTIRPKGSKQLKKIGVVPDVFCEGESIIREIDIWPIISFYRANSETAKLESQSIGDLVTGSPFGEHIYPAQIINIPREEIMKAFAKSDLFWSRLFQVIVEKLFVNKWRLWFQLSNKADAKLLSVLYLYFIGKLPLQLWKAKGITVKSEVLCVKKPNTLIDEFEVSIKELTLFSGLTRKYIRELLEGGVRIKKKDGKVVSTVKIKSIFEKDERLAQVLKCSAVNSKITNQEGYYNFSTPHLLYLLERLEFRTLFSGTQKFV